MQLLRNISQSLGLVPNGKRNVTPVPANLLALVPKPDGKNEVIKSSGADPEKDTVPLIKKLAKRQMWQGKKLAEALKGKNLAETVRNDWNFIFDHIQYKLDPEGSETVRSLRRLIHDGKGDCDCFSNGLANLFLNQKINFAFRIAAYNNSDDWSHIYLVVPKDGKKISNGYYTIDPVVHQFNYEVPFTTKKDFSMNLVSLDGVHSRGILGACPVKEEKNTTKSTGFYVPSTELKLKGLIATQKLLTEENIPFTTSLVDGKPVHTVGNVTLPTLTKIGDKNQLVAALKQNLLQPDVAGNLIPVATGNEEEKIFSTDAKKKLGIAALVLFGVAALAQQFKTKPGVGIGAPPKKMAFVKF